MRDTIIANVTGKSTCGAITGADLAGIARLPVHSKSITALKAGDFNGLTNMTTLTLDGNNLTGLPAGIFDGLTNLSNLNLSFNSFATLPAGIFDGLTSLTDLYLQTNGLTSLPAGIFDKLTNLDALNLAANNLTCLPFIPNAGGIISLLIDASALGSPACGAAVTVGAARLSLERLDATATYTVALAAGPNHGLNGGVVTVTPVSSDPGVAGVSGPLTFTPENWNVPQRVTVTSLGDGTASISHAAAGGGYDAAAAGSVSVSAKVQQPGQPAKPGAFGGDGSVTLTWTDTDAGDAPILRWEYQQRLDGAAFGAWQQIPGSGAATRRHRVEGLVNGAAYRFRVRAVNAFGAGPASIQTDAVFAGEPDLEPDFGDAAVAAIELRRNDTLAPLTLPAAAGGDGELTYALTPALPAGLVFDAVSRVLSGTPSAPHPAGTFTLTATDADGDTAELGFTLGVAEDLAPSFGDARLPDQAYTAGLPVIPLTLPPAAGGDGTLAYALSPALPPGLAFDAATRVLSGTPSEARPAGAFTLTATDADGDTAQLGFILGVAPDLAPGFGDARLPDQAYTAGLPIAPLTLPSATGGDGELSYALTPALPEGLVFDPATRRISGTPSRAHPETAFTLTATDADGDTAQLNFVLAVAEDRMPSFGDATLADLELKQNDPLAPVTLPPATGGDGTLTYALAPVLPAGLVFNAATRQISGTPSAPRPATSFTLTATDADGDAATLAFTLAVAPDLAPSFGDTTLADLELKENDPVAPLTLPSASGGDGDLTYALDPAPPAGLAFDAATRTLSGTPGAPSPRTRHTLTATDSDGDAATLAFTIAVAADLAPGFGDATLADLELTQNAAVAPVTLPSATGGDGELTYALDPAPPAGLVLDAVTRTLSGTPSAPVARTLHVWRATDADGDVAELSFAVTVAADAMPVFGVSSLPELRLASNRRMAPLRLPAASGGDGALTYALAPELPPGLAFDAATRTLSGLPGGESAAREYVYTATDSDPSGADAARLTLRIGVSVSEDTRQVLEGALAAQGRALLGDATEVVGERFRAPRAASPQGASPLSATIAAALAGAVGGDRQAPNGDRHTTRTTQGDTHRATHGDRHIPPRGGRAADFDLGRLLDGRTFALSLAATGGAGRDWTLWGAASVRRFEGDADPGRHDGGLDSLYLGADTRLGTLTAGAALAFSRGDADYAHDMRSGQLETELVALHPYLRGETASGLEFWVLGGFGDGTATHRPDDAGAAREEAELAMRMAAGGVRRRLGTRGGLDFALVGSLGYLSLGTDGNGGAVAELDAGVSQGRFALEVARAGPLAPYLRVGGRADDGDGETGGGLELAAGVRHEAGRLAFEGRVRALAARFDGEHGEYGVTARLAYRARADGGGLRLSLSPSWGAAEPGIPFGAAGTAPATLRGVAARPGGAALRAGLGYGIALDGGLLSLNAEHEHAPFATRRFAGLEWAASDAVSVPLRGLKLCLGHAWEGASRLSGPSLRLTYARDL